MIRRYNDILSQTGHFAPSESACSKEELPEELQSLASYLNSCGFPCYQNTQEQYFPLGDDAIASRLFSLGRLGAIPYPFPALHGRAVRFHAPQR